MGQGISSPIKKKDSKKSQVIADLEKMTRLSHAELKISYDKFMEDNPSGGISREDFFTMFEESSFADSENCRTLVERIFDAYDIDGNGTIDVKEFLVTISLASRGTVSEKLSWAFDLYDGDSDNFITREEAMQIIKALYEMEGSSDADERAKETTDDLFNKLDRNDDDLLSREEFLAGARSATIIGKLLPGC